MWGSVNGLNLLSGDHFLGNTCCGIRYAVMVRECPSPASGLAMWQWKRTWKPESMFTTCSETINAISTSVNFSKVLCFSSFPFIVIKVPSWDIAEPHRKSHRWTPFSFHTFFLNMRQLPRKCLSWPPKIWFNRFQTTRQPVNRAIKPCFANSGCVTAALLGKASQLQMKWISGISGIRKLGPWPSFGTMGTFT